MCVVLCVCVCVVCVCVCVVCVCARASILLLCVWECRETGRKRREGVRGGSERREGGRREGDLGNAVQGLGLRV